MTNTTNNPRRRHVTRKTQAGKVTARCRHCKETISMPDKGIGRATIAAWETRHQHPEEDHR